MKDPNENATEDLRCSTGIAGLDDILRGGLPRGHFFLIEGEPGSGKTTVGLQFLMEGVRQGESVLYITLSESIRELHSVARSHGWSLDNVRLFEYRAYEDSLRPEQQYSAFHPSEVEFQDTTQTILAEVDRVQPSRIVFDSLSELRLLARDSLRYRRQILALKHFFTNRNCTVLLLDDGTGDAHDTQLQSIAHGVLRLQKVPRDYGRERRRIQIAKMRGCVYREGYHDYTIETGGVAIYPRLVASEHRRPSTEGCITSGNERLDSLFGTGITRGTSTLLLGPAGSGKSTVAMAFAVAAARRGEPAAVFLFEELLQTALSRCSKLDMDPRPFVDSGLIHMEQVDPAELSPGEFVYRVREQVERRNATVVVIDSLNGFLNAMPDETHLHIQMHELLTFLNQWGVATLLVLSQAGIVGTHMSSPVDLSYLADGVLLFRYFEAAGKVRKAISIVKQRSGQHEDTIRELDMSGCRLAIGEPLSEFRGILTGVPMYVGSENRLQENSGGK